MKKAKLVLEEGYYNLKKSNDSRLNTLSYFLTDDVSNRRGVDSFKEWINDERYEDTESNASFLEKEDDNIVIGWLHADVPYNGSLNVTKNNLLTILDQWKKLMEELPQEIIITLENGVVKLEGKN